MSVEKALRNLIRQIVREELSRETKPPTPQPTEGDLDPRILYDIKWTSFATKKEAEEGERAWAFANDRQGNPLKETLPIIQAIWDSGEDKITIGNYEVSISGQEGKFLNRTPLRKGRKR